MWLKTGWDPPPPNNCTFFSLSLSSPYKVCADFPFRFCWFVWVLAFISKRTNINAWQPCHLPPANLKWQVLWAMGGAYQTRESFIQCITRRSRPPLQLEILRICTALTKRTLVRNVHVWWQGCHALTFVLVLLNAKTQTNQQNLKGKSAHTYKVN